MRKVVSTEVIENVEVTCDKCGRPYDDDMKYEGDGDEFTHCPVCERDLCNKCYGNELNIFDLGYYNERCICEDCKKLFDENMMNSDYNEIHQEYLSICVHISDKMRELEEDRRAASEKRKSDLCEMYQFHVDNAKIKRRMNNGTD